MDAIAHDHPIAPPLRSRMRETSGDNKEETRRWSRLLDREMTKRGLSNVALASLSGIQRERIWRWRTGFRLPLLENASILAEVLSCHAILTMVVAIRSKDCATCGTGFVDGSSCMTAKYCGNRCRLAAEARRQRATRGSLGVFAHARLDIYKKTIAKFCQECEPEGLCRDAVCPIQAAGISPLPLVKRRTA